VFQVKSLAWRITAGAASLGIMIVGVEVLQFFQRPYNREKMMIV